mmetsp:Transcript_41291/g.109484  ORF Transcript_41291/g.109484 Transcript_41291/m.109484 type:complete len:213 (-) Transcript_41291:162-800(-)
MVPRDLRVRQCAQILHLSAGLCGVAAGRVEQVEHGAVDQRVAIVLAPLHLAIDDTLVLALARHVADLCGERLVRQARIQDMVGEDRQQVERALVACRVERVACVVGRRPRVGPVGERAVGELVEDPLVGIQLAAQEYGVLQRVRQAVILVRPVVCVGLRRDCDKEARDGLRGREERAAQPGHRRLKRLDAQAAGDRDLLRGYPFGHCDRGTL